MSDLFVGVDGCRAGWIAVMAHGPAGSEPSIRLYGRLDDLIRDLRGAHATVAVDMPIGLLDEPVPGGRPCDRLARAVLRPPRAASIFSPPTRRILHASAFSSALGVSRQGFGLLKKMAELDAVMTPPLQRDIVEAHPELAFCRLAGHPMREAKKTSPGQQERLVALSTIPVKRHGSLAEVVVQADPAYRRGDVARDDLLDATVLLWTAWSIGAGDARRLHGEPRVDTRGLRMEIWY